MSLKVKKGHIVIYAIIRRMTSYINYISDLKDFSKISKNCDHRFSLHWEDIYPCLNDKSDTIPFDAHYIYHPNARMDAAVSGFRSLPS